ncbi:MAG TPA: DHA2 family efflux MFS transporter permease subunit [Rhodoblastus sp.]|nr:DHA2 family efflux MFS transporter permease subunit [Rhodoblastus sp.]
MSAADPQVPNRGLLTVCVMAATIMQALDTTIANVALPYMQGSLSATQDQITWVLTSYIVSAAIFMPTTGFLTARFGRKKLLIVAVAGFTLASGLCGAAQTLGQMVIFRLLQGVFGAALVPMSQAILLDSYPREKHGSAMAIWGVGVMVGPILGPMLGGWLTEYYNWRWVFYINVPIGVAVVFGLLAVLTESRTQEMRFDWFGFATLSLAVGALQMMLDRGQLVDWFSSTEIVFEAALAVLALYLFLVHMATADRPFIDPHLFADHNFRVGIMLIFVVGVILLASVALLTPYLQTLMGYPVLTAGLILGPRGIGTMVAMMIVGRLLGRIDPRIFLLLGLGLSSFSLYEMTWFTPDVSARALLINGIVQGTGLGFLFTPLSTVTFATLPAHLRTQATALFSLLRNLGSSIGVSVVMFMLARNMQIMHAELVHNASPLNPALRVFPADQIWNLKTLAGRAALNMEISKQAEIIAYMNDYKLLAILALAAAPLVLLLGKPEDRMVDPAHAVME